MDYAYQKVSTSSDAGLPFEPRASDHRRPTLADLLTVFRKSTASGPRRSIYHASPPSTSGYRPSIALDPDDLLRGEREVDAREGGGKAGPENEEDDDETRDSTRPLTRHTLLKRIRQKKEVINKLRCQAWPMNRKRRTLRLAQKYLEQNESKVSKGHLYREELKKRWRWFRRWIGNVSIYLIPWESKIKKIESQFGSVVSSYFTFLRWIIYLNVILTLLIAALVVVPEVIADATADRARQNRTHSRKVIPADERRHADELQVVWHYDGYLRYSPLFYGYYSNDAFVGRGTFRYPLPLFYFIATLLVFGCSFCAILRKMALNARRSKLSGSKAEQYIFNWRLFTGWDYSIGNAETASNTAMAVVIKLRESITECQVQQSRKIRVDLIGVRVLTNFTIILMIAFSIYLIYSAVQSSETVEKTGNLFTKNQVPSVVATITHVFPMIFDLIGRIEKHHPRVQLRLHLIRVLVLYVINYGTLIFALFEKLDTITYITKEPVTADASTTINPAPSRWSAGTAEPIRRREDSRTAVGADNHSPPFTSRNFTTRRDLVDFLSTKPTDSQWASASVVRQKRQFTTRRVTNYPYATSPPPTKNATATPQTVTVDGTEVTVHAQFGPVGLNNPDALLRNTTSSKAGPKTVSKAMLEYETRRIGPTPLPLFTPPPPPPTSRTPIFRQQDFGGPDWVYGRTPPPPPTIIYVPDSEGTTTAPSSPHDDFNGSVPENARHTTDDELQFNDQICWETMIGQEIVRLVTMDLYITIATVLVIDFLRGLWIRYCSSWWFWDIETTFPEYGEFKVAENVLHIINNQGMVWLGLFFAPLLPALNNVKMIVILYIRAWAVMTSNVPAREIFRASRSSNFFLMILLLWLLLCTLPVGYVITSKKPSTVCGSFAGKDRFYDVISDLIEAHVNSKFLKWMRYVVSPGVIVPIILLLVLVIFFLFSLVRGLREANTDLQKQLVHERTEEKRKIFVLAGGRNKKKTSGGMETLSSGKQKPSQYLPEVEQKRREPWRLYNGTDHVPSLCPSDEKSLASSLNSPTTETASPHVPLSTTRSKGTEDREAAASEPMSPRSKISFRPSLGSVEEVSDQNPLSNDGGDSRVGTLADFGGSTRRSNAWTMSGAENDTTRSDDKSTADSHVGTPDELRSLIAPYMEGSLWGGEAGETATGVSLAGFPRESSFTSGQLTVIFGTAGLLGSAGGLSQRSASRRSGSVCTTSLYDNYSGVEEISSKRTPPERTFSRIYYRAGGQNGGRTNMSWTAQTVPSIHSTCISLPLRVPGPTMVGEGHPNNGISPLMTRSTTLDGSSPAPEAPQRISLYTREPRRFGPLPLEETAIQGVPELMSTSMPGDAMTRLVRRGSGPREPAPRTPQQPSTSAAQQRRGASQSPGRKKFETRNVAGEFVPWPSIEEVRAEKAHLFQSAPPLEASRRGSQRSSMDSGKASSKPPRGRSPPKIVRSGHWPSASANEPTKFRISVSPTRKLHPDSGGSEGEDGGKAAGRRTTRYVIKQQVFAGSTSSFGSKAATAGARGPETPLSPLSSKPSTPGTPRAPRVEFGEDDSPRVEQPPKRKK